MRFLGFWYFLLLPLSLATVFLLGKASTERETSVQGRKWWHDAIFYQIWPRSFQDSDGDGIGDFQGMTSKLDYLADLGINAIWLNPVFEAPSYHGYDFQQFYQVESDYGTMADLEEFLEEAEQRGIKVIGDLVLNHISTEHEWFQKSVRLEHPYSDYFIWRQIIPEGHWGKPWAQPGTVGYNKPKWVWIYNQERNSYYYAPFDGSQPDLNLEHPQVMQELKKVTKFWLDKGFDGFRLDAMRYGIETGPYPNQADTPSTIDFWLDYNSYVKSLGDDILLIGEVWAPIEIISRYYGGVDLCFDFNFGHRLINALNKTTRDTATFGTAEESPNDKETVKEAFQANIAAKLEGVAPVNFYSPFLTNHDQERVMYKLGNDEGKMKIAAVLLFTVVGTPYIYYGEEIGMSQNRTGDDQYKRSPMQWDDSKLAGFTTGDEVWIDDSKWFPWLPEHEPWWREMWDSVVDKRAASVAGQKEDPNSLFHLYRKLIAIRKANPEFRAIANESLEFIPTASPDIIAFLRKAPTGEVSAVIINTTTTQPNIATIDYFQDKQLINLLNGDKMVFPEGEVNLDAGSFYILKIQ